MADVNNRSNNTSIVKILVISLLVLALLYYFGFFGPRETVTPAGDRTNVNIEQPAGTTIRSTPPSITAPARPANGTPARPANGNR